MTPSGAKLIVVSVAAACAGVLLALPQPIEPSDPGTLRLNASENAHAEARDRELATGAPTGEEAETLMALFREHGAAEADAGEPRAVRLDREDRFNRALARFTEIHGADGLSALRAKACEGLASALDGGLDDETERATLGAFPRLLEQYGLSRNGEVTAPPFVVRTLYKARWNSIHDLPLTDGFEDGEARAYWGWLAVEGIAPPSLRLDAVERFHAIDQRAAIEAAAYIAYARGDFGRATNLYGELATGGDLRLRNHALASVRRVE